MTRGIASVCKSRAIFITQWSIYDEAFLQKQLTAFNFFCKKLIIDVQPGSKYTSEKDKNFQGEANVEQIIAIFTMLSVSCY